VVKRVVYFSVDLHATSSTSTAGSTATSTSVVTTSVMATSVSLVMTLVVFLAMVLLGMLLMVLLGMLLVVLLGSLLGSLLASSLVVGDGRLDGSLDSGDNAVSSGGLVALGTTESRLGLAHITALRGLHRRSLTILTSALFTSKLAELALLTTFVVLDGSERILSRGLVGLTLGLNLSVNAREVLGEGGLFVGTTDDTLDG